MTDAREPRLDGPGSGRDAGPDLAAPRRVFKRRKRRGLVLAMKIVLPTVAIVGIGYVVIWSRTHQSTINPIEVVAGVSKQGSDVTVRQVKYDGVDARNRPFSITAVSAVQPQNALPPPQPVEGLGDDASDKQKKFSAEQAPAATQPKQPNVINLEKPIADMTMADGAWVAVTADSGVYDRDAGTVDLSGNVNLFHDTGLSFETDAARVDFKNESASGNQPVEGGRPDGELAAEGFEVRNGGRTVLFTGRAYLKLYPSTSGGATTKSTSPKPSSGNGS
ncbi:MAG TPA: LPS export ABC transporter periplasmic protein LptC [Candidatus Binatia bacterium]|nr:LPS export ABC transporter periplasmic protein LptC [Candidatus Binatia bacterium]